MTRTQSWFLKYVIATAATVIIGAAVIHAAHAGSREVNRSWTGPQGGSGSVTKSWNRNDGTWNRSATRTGPNGKTMQRDTQRTVDPGKSRTYSNTTTLPSGSTIQRNRSITNNGDSVTVNREVTGPQGKTGSVTRTWPKQ